MGQRFNPPPNWPRVPEGWSPPPGWQPDPAWGPPPPGWPLWIEESPDRARPRLRAAIFGATCVVGATAIATVAFTIGHDPAPGSPSDDVRAVGEVEPGTPAETPGQHQPTPVTPPAPAPSATPEEQPSRTTPGRGFARQPSERGPQLRPPSATDRPGDSYKYYADCEVARIAGAAPLRRGEPGYRPALDPDRDGIACDG